MKTGTQNAAIKTGKQNVAIKTGMQNIAMLRVTGLLIAISGPPGMSPPGTKFSHLGMSLSRPRAACNGEGRS